MESKERNLESKIVVGSVTLDKPSVSLPSVTHDCYFVRDIGIFSLKNNKQSLKQTATKQQESQTGSAKRRRIQSESSVIFLPSKNKKNKRANDHVDLDSLL